MLITIITLTGCMKQELRTGKICVQPIVTQGCRVSDPIMVTSAIVQQAASLVEQEMIAEIGRETKFDYVNDCSIADFILKSRIVRMKYHLITYHSFPLFFKSNSESKFNIYVEANLENTKGLRLAHSEAEADRSNFTDATISIGQEIINDVKYRPAQGSP